MINPEKEKIQRIVSMWLVGTERTEGYLKSFLKNFQRNWNFICSTRKRTCASSLTLPSEVAHFRVSNCVVHLERVDHSVVA